MTATGPSSLNLVLGSSLRSAVLTMKEHKDAKTVCIIGPNPRALRSMDEEDIIECLAKVGQIMTTIRRLEIHFYHWTPNISIIRACPVKALTAILRSCKKLTYLLINGMRFSGTQENVEELGMAFEEHKQLFRLCFFNTIPLDPQALSLSPLLEGIRRSKTIKDVGLRYSKWVGPHLGTVCDSFSNIVTLRLTGGEILGPTGLSLMMEALKTNKTVKELAINQCAPSLGRGELVGEMLVHNTKLTALVIELYGFAEVVPIAKALHKNRTLKKVDVFCFSETTPQKKSEEVAAAKIEFEEALKLNTSIVHLVMKTRIAVETSPNLDLLLHLNRAGRKNLLQNDNLSWKDFLDFLMKHKHDQSMIWYLISSKPSLLEQFVCPKTPEAMSMKMIQAATGKQKPRKTRVKTAATSAANSKRKISSSAMSQAPKRKRK